MVSSLFLPSPTGILAKLFDILFVSLDIWHHLLSSLKRLVLGVALAALVGASLGILMGSSERMYRFLDKTIEIRRSRFFDRFPQLH
jgi:ABC-type nitrate/sulfonate/bicarbonate transport system permease component